MTTTTTSNNLRISALGISPLLKQATTNPPTGPALDYMAALSSAMQGAIGSSDIYALNDSQRVKVGEWMALGGVVSVGITLPNAGVWVITLPGLALHNAPMMFSDNQIIWPIGNSNFKNPVPYTVTVTTTHPSTDAWMTYWG